MSFTLRRTGANAAGAPQGQLMGIDSQGRSQVAASGDLMGLLSLQKVTASINDAASKIKRRRDRWKEIKSVFGDWTHPIDARLSGWQVLTCSTEPKAATSTGVALDEGTVPKQMSSIAFQFQRVGKLMMADMEDEVEALTAQLNAWSQFLSKETLSMLGVDVDPTFYLLMESSTGGVFSAGRVEVELDMTAPY